MFVRIKLCSEKLITRQNIVTPKGTVCPVHWANRAQAIGRMTKVYAICPGVGINGIHQEDCHIRGTEASVLQHQEHGHLRYDRANRRLSSTSTRRTFQLLLYCLACEGTLGHRRRNWKWLTWTSGKSQVMRLQNMNETYSQIVHSIKWKGEPRITPVQSRLTLFGPLCIRPKSSTSSLICHLYI